MKKGQPTLQELRQLIQKNNAILQTKSPKTTSKSKSKISTSRPKPSRKKSSIHEQKKIKKQINHLKNELKRLEPFIVSMDDGPTTTSSATDEHLVHMQDENEALFNDGEVPLSPIKDFHEMDEANGVGDIVGRIGSLENGISIMTQQHQKLYQLLENAQLNVHKKQQLPNQEDNYKNEIEQLKEKITLLERSFKTSIANTNIGFENYKNESQMKQNSHENRLSEIENLLYEIRDQQNHIVESQKSLQEQINLMIYVDKKTNHAKHSPSFNRTKEVVTRNSVSQIFDEVPPIADASDVSIVEERRAQYQKLKQAYKRVFREDLD